MDIVIYEEDYLTRTLLMEWLSEAGHCVRIGTASDSGPRVAADLVILSVCLPKHAGAQSVRSIQTAHPGTPLIAISGHFRPGLSVAGAAAQALGVQQVLAKPLARRDLLHAVSAAMNKSA